MFNVMPAIRSGAALGIQPPNVIFGANLTDWFISDVGVTVVDNGGQDEVLKWANQATGGDIDEHAPASTLRPNYDDPGVGGTPDVHFVNGTPAAMAFTDAIKPEFTAYIFAENTAGFGNSTNLLWGASNHGLFHGLSPHHPSIFNGSHFVGTVSNLGWASTRYSVRDNGVGVSSIAVDDNAEETGLVNWIVGVNWINFSRQLTSQVLRARVKQFLIVDQYVDDADPRHQQLLDYFKDEYPTLVTY